MAEAERLDKTTLRLGNGSVVGLPPTLVEFKIDGENYIVRSRQELHDGVWFRTEARLAEGNQRRWSVTSRIDEDVALDNSQKNLLMDGAVVPFEFRVISVVVADATIVICADSASVPRQNVFAVNRKGRHLWQIGSAAISVTTPYLGISPSRPGLLDAYNKADFSVLVRYRDGGVVETLSAH